jgi:DNA ligase-1
MSRLVILKNQFEELAKAKGNSKKPLMKMFVQDPESGPLFIEVYNFVFNPFITTGIAKKKFDKCKVGKNDRMQLQVDIMNMLSYVESNNTGTDYVVSFLKGWILDKPEETHEFLKGVFTKDLQLGISEKGLNEALGYEHIPIHEIMLAKKWEREEHKVKGDFFITLKMDDYRTTCIYNEEVQKWELKARSGFNFEGVGEIEAILNELPKDMVFDGGLISTDDTLEAKDRFRHTGKLLKTEGPKTGLMFYIYDMLPYEEYKKGKSKLNYKNRQMKIIDLLNHFDDGQFNNLFLPAGPTAVNN